MRLLNDCCFSSRRIVLGFAIALLYLPTLSSLQKASAIDLLQENFDDVPLMNSVGFLSEVRGRNVWTDQMPSPFSSESWSVDNSQMPAGTVGDNNIGVLEFEGWRIVDRDWWVQTAGGQDRQDFVSASGSVMVADPDEWDDFPNESGTQNPTEIGLFDSTLKIANIPLQSIAENTANLSFFSSWRPEAFDDGDNTNNQSASLRAIYDDGASTVVDLFTWDSDEASPNYKPDATNEFVNVALQNPTGANNVTLEFRLFNAANDWWWAIDNLNMFTGTSPGTDGVLRLIIDRDTKDVRIVNNTGNPIDLTGYSIESGNGTLDESIAAFLGNTDSDWTILNNPNSAEISEGHLNFETIPAFDSLNPDDNKILLGNAWRQFYQDFSDISFTYAVDGISAPITGIVEFTGNGGESFNFLDLNYSGGDPDYADYQAFLDGYGSTSLEGKLLAERHALGDLNNDGVFSVQDFLEFQRQFDAFLGVGAFAAMLQGATVPEPSTMFLLSSFGLTCLAIRRRKISPRFMGIVVTVAAFALCSPKAQAQLLLYEEDFESVVLGASPEEDTSQTNVWSDTFAGWTIDGGVRGSNMPQTATPNPGDGVVDWAGWAFTDKDFWVDAAGDQRRSEFTRGSGTVLVADPDEWDDDDPVDQTAPYTYFDTVIRSPVINIPAGIDPGKLRVAFDSSWRDEGLDDGAVGDTNNQTAEFEVFYSGGNASSPQLLKYQSNPLEDDFKDDAPNEGVDLDAQYDGTDTSMQLEFRLGMAWNDWWWAIDNVRVFVPADPSILQINVNTGQASIIGGDTVSVDINSIDIQSANGNLDPAANAGLSFTKPDSIDGIDPDSIVDSNIGESWQKAGANENYFSEFFLEGSSEFTSSRTEPLGQIFDPSTNPGFRDVSFTYTNLFGTEVDGIVQYVGVTGDNADFDNSGLVDGADFLIWQRFLGTTGATAFSSGDANGDGNVDDLDLTIWRNQYGTSALVAAVASVPEPTSAMLLVLGALCVAGRRGSRRKAAEIVANEVSNERKFMNRSLTAILLCSFLAVAQTAQAVVPAPTLDRDYNFGEDDTTNGQVGGPAVSAGDQVDRAFDNAATDTSSGASQQFIDLLSFNVGSTGATYENVVGRPDGGTGLGVLLNGVPSFGNFYARKHHLRTFAASTGGAQLALNMPVRSPSSEDSDFGTGSSDYKFITDRGFQLWAQPQNLPDGADDAHVVMDSNNHGVFIQNDGTFAMRYAGLDYTGVTQVTQQTINADTWYHLMVVRPFGPSSGSILYVNGVAEAAATGTYLGEQDVTAEEVLPPEEIDDAALVVGANTAELPSQMGQNNFFSGMVDDLEMFIMGFNDSADYGEFEFARDNKYAAHFNPATEGDLNGDNMVTTADATIFASNWLFEKRLEWSQGAQDRSLRVGDLSTRLLGDFDFSGRIDLADWQILNAQNPTAAAFAASLISGAVPEPSSLMLLASAITLLGGYGRRVRNRA